MAEVTIVKQCWNCQNDNVCSAAVYQSLHLGVTVVLCPLSSKHHYAIHENVDKVTILDYNGEDNNYVGELDASANDFLLMPDSPFSAIPRSGQLQTKIC